MTWGPCRKKGETEVLKLQRRRGIYRGQASLPCNIRAPIANQREFKIPKWLSIGPPLELFHSYGLNRPIRNKPTLTVLYATTMQIQILASRGSMKENTPGFMISGFLIMILIPKFIKGLVKSTTFSRVYRIVSGAIQMSASCKRENWMIFW